VGQTTFRVLNSMTQSPRKGSFTPSSISAFSEQSRNQVNLVVSKEKGIGMRRHSFVVWQACSSPERRKHLRSETTQENNPGLRPTRSESWHSTHCGTANAQRPGVSGKEAGGGLRGATSASCNSPPAAESNDLGWQIPRTPAAPMRSTTPYLAAANVSSNGGRRRFTSGRTTWGPFDAGR